MGRLQVLLSLGDWCWGGLRLLRLLGLLGAWAWDVSSGRPGENVIQGKETKHGDETGA